MPGTERSGVPLRRAGWSQRAPVLSTMHSSTGCSLYRECEVLEIRFILADTQASSATHKLTTARVKHNTRR
jgi:hypothetical protein